MRISWVAIVAGLGVAACSASPNAFPGVYGERVNDRSGVGSSESSPPTGTSSSSSGSSSSSSGGTTHGPSAPSAHDGGADTPSPSGGSSSGGASSSGSSSGAATTPDAGTTTTTTPPPDATGCECGCDDPCLGALIDLCAKFPSAPGCDQLPDTCTCLQDCSNGPLTCDVGN